MNAEDTDHGLSRLAVAIAEPARARMLCCLMDGRAKTATELALVAGVGAPTASVHLARLKEQGLISVLAQGKHRYFQLAGAEVAAALEALLQLANVPQPRFKPTTPNRLRHARTCYDHMAGEVAVALHDALLQQGWLAPSLADAGAYELSAAGAVALEQLGLDVAAIRKSRRRFACACLDWSERKPHLGGALGAALLSMMLQRAWVERDFDSRALSLTRTGKAQFQRQFGNLHIAK